MFNYEESNHHTGGSIPRFMRPCHHERPWYYGTKGREGLCLHGPDVGVLSLPQRLLRTRKLFGFRTCRKPSGSPSDGQASVQTLLLMKTGQLSLDMID